MHCEQTIIPWMGLFGLYKKKLINKMKQFGAISAFIEFFFPQWSAKDRGMIQLYNGEKCRVRYPSGDTWDLTTLV